MAGGQAIVQASSEAWPEYGAQAVRSLNTGWVLDQRFDGAGGFITNATPTSSGQTFQSTGDATAFYTCGRVIRVIQSALTTVGTVGLSSYNGTITNIYLTGVFSTGAGSTALSTGAITSAAASANVATGTTGNAIGNIMPNLYSSSSGLPFFTPFVAVGPSTSSAPAASGDIRLRSGGSINLRNVSGSTTADLVAIATDASNNMTLGNTNVATLGVVAGSEIDLRQSVFSTGVAAFGSGSTQYAASGALRLPYSTGATIMQRNSGNTADEQIWPLFYATTALSADVNLSTVAGTYVDGPAFALPAGTWLVHGQVLVGNSLGVSGPTYTAKLWDGTTLLASAEFTVASANAAGTIPLVGIASSSATWKISVAQSNPSSSGLIKAAAFNNGNPAKASVLTAVKIQ